MKHSDEAIDRAQLSHVHINKKYSSENIWLNVDRSRMEIALLNIIVNALEAMNGEQQSAGAGNRREKRSVYYHYQG